MASGRGSYSRISPKDGPNCYLYASLERLESFLPIPCDPPIHFAHHRGQAAMCDGGHFLYVAAQYLPPEIGADGRANRGHGLLPICRRTPVVIAHGAFPAGTAPETLPFGGGGVGSGLGIVGFVCFPAGRIYPREDAPVVAEHGHAATGVFQPALYHPVAAQGIGT